MIKNIIFDIGGVIFDESVEHVNKLLNEDSTSIYKKVYGKSFRECVLGNIELDDYILSFKDDPDYEKIKIVLDKNNLSITYPLLKDNYEYIKSLKDKGYNLYILSNIAKETYEYVNNTINIDSTFIGGVYSYKEHLVKPGIDIFELIVNRYNLNKSETIFFDDKQRNIDSANEYGIKSYLFKSIEDVIEVIDGYRLIKSSTCDIDKLIEYKKNTIYEYAKELDDNEINRINNYVENNVPKQLDDYSSLIIDNKVVGCLLITNKDDGVLLDEIFIEEEYRNKGIGTTLIKNVLKNNSIVYLWVYKDNIKAINLYKRLGFNIINETDTRYYMKYTK